MQFQRKYSLVIPANAGIQLLSRRATSELPLSSFPRKRESILILASIEELDSGVRRNDGDMDVKVLC